MKFRFRVGILIVMQQRVLGRGAVVAQRWHVRLMEAHKANEAAIGTATTLRILRHSSLESINP
jgi:hypothetical protein